MTEVRGRNHAHPAALETGTPVFAKTTTAAVLLKLKVDG